MYDILRYLSLNVNYLGRCTGEVRWCWSNLIFPEDGGRYWCVVIFCFAFCQIFWLSSLSQQENWKSIILGIEIEKSLNQMNLKTLKAVFFYFFHLQRTFEDSGHIFYLLDLIPQWQWFIQKIGPNMIKD